MTFKIELEDTAPEHLKEVAKKCVPHIEAIGAEIEKIIEISRAPEHQIMAAEAILAIYAGFFGPLIKDANGLNTLMSQTIDRLQESYKHANGHDNLPGTEDEDDGDKKKDRTSTINSSHTLH